MLAGFFSKLFEPRHSVAGEADEVRLLLGFCQYALDPQRQTATRGWSLCG
jgi:hypothetical protein